MKERLHRRGHHQPNVQPRFKVTILADVPSPHQLTFFEALAARGDLDLEVAFCRRHMEKQGGWRNTAIPPGLPHRFLPEWRLRDVPLNPTLLPYLARRRGGVAFVIGYYLPGMLLAGLFLRFSGRAWVFWTDTLPTSQSTGNLLKRWLRSRILNFFLHQSTLTLTTGRSGLRALQRHGVPKEKSAQLPFVVAQDWIMKTVEERRGEAHHLRESEGISQSAVVFLFVGQLVDRKGVDVLLDAFGVMTRSSQKPVFLILVGDGQRREFYSSQVQQLGLDECVGFAGTVPHQRLPLYWSMANVFVLPSRFDPWPVAVVEAASAGLPIIGSDASGSVADCIRSESGWIIPAGRVQPLADALLAAVDAGPERLSQMGLCARAVFRDMNPITTAKAFSLLVRKLVAM